MNNRNIVLYSFFYFIVVLLVGYIVGTEHQIKVYRENTQSMVVQVAMEKDENTIPTEAYSFAIKRFDYDNLYGFYVEYPVIKELFCK